MLIKIAKFVRMWMCDLHWSTTCINLTRTTVDSPLECRYPQYCWSEHTAYKSLTNNIIVPFNIVNLLYIVVWMNSVNHSTDFEIF